MHFEPHAALGWAIGNIGNADRQLRRYCVIGAILPDIDAIPYVFGAQVYGRWHHTFGHNVFLWALFTGWVTYKCRSKRALLLSFLCFGSHLLADAKLSEWNLQLFWPFSKTGYLFPGSISLGAPMNTHLVYYSFLLVGVLAWLYKRTPVDLFSTRLDQLLISFFQRKALSCAICSRPGNQRCAHCHRPICARHGALRKQWVLVCPKCATSGGH